MKLPSCSTLNLRFSKGCLHIQLNRPEIGNALNLAMVNELVNVFSSIERNRDVRAVVLKGAGRHFCVGGDVKEMIQGGAGEDDAGGPSFQANLRFGALLSLAARLPQVLIACISGSAMGGGLGLVCVSDFAVSTRDAVFALPETGLGVPPAQVLPFLTQRVGLTQARSLVLIGHPISGLEAKGIGLVHHVCATAGELDFYADRIIAQVMTRAPGANAAAKSLMLQVGLEPLPALLEKGAVGFSACLRSEEGREGMAAFLEKRSPYWTEE